MQLLILRHGEAEPMVGEDSERQLTDRGRAQVAWICDRRADELAQVRAIWASPFVRTQQTAQIVAGRLRQRVDTQPILVGDTDPQEVLDALGRAAHFPLLLVTHNPLASILVNDLCGSAGAHSLGTASLACLESEVWADGCAELSWLQHPEA
ncbi:SixA phosphatase family protein [Microbulbifer yueqingensis]|uniref:Phosphohistidine phosphatase, SixA n=1 Tax=Microbulbifer yueqingensis TaxID=658219 RepID=A0A1G8V5V6_9GAMM|nr:histidine phosphatase family protein [Microbulbifer yueqingensis]SDJ61458.1 phosphohistidine phosphatase, SixA [Microbulbifer yueqingensis]